jgi:hypothetical protein
MSIVLLRGGFDPAHLRAAVTWRSDRHGRRPLRIVDTRPVAAGSLKRPLWRH